MAETFNTIAGSQATGIRRELIVKPILMGILGIFILFGIYLGILSILNSPEYAYYQSVLLANWLIPLVFGFGIQLSLFFYMRGYGKLVKQGVLHKGTVVASAGISTGAMIACCLHHAVEVLPFIGLSALAAVLGQYQTFLLAVGIVSNLIGISYLIHTIKKHRLFVKNGLMEHASAINSRLLFSLTSAFSVVFLSIIFFNQYI